MAEFESDLIRSRTRDAVAAAAAADKMKRRQHKLTPEERAYLLQTYELGQLKIEIQCRKTGLKSSHCTQTSSWPAPSGTLKDSRHSDLGRYS